MTDFLKEYRSKYPQYNDLDDNQLVTALHGKYNADKGLELSFDEFSQAIEYQPIVQEPIEQELPEGIDAITGAAVSADPYPQAKPWEPSLWERFKELGGPDKASAINEAYAQRKAQEEQIPVEDVYKQAGFVRPILNPEGRPTIQTIVEGTSIVAEQLPDVGKATVNSLLRVVRGGDETAEKNFLDEAIEATEPATAESIDPNYKNLYGLGKSFGFSFAVLANTALASFAAAPTVVSAPAAGFAAGTTTAYRASKDEFLDRIKLKADEYSEKISGRPLNQEEWTKVYNEYEAAAQKYGLWESIPEGLSNLVFMRALALPLKGMSKEGLTEALKRVGQVMVSEQATETVTGVGQSYAEAEAGLGEVKTVGEAFRDQTVQTGIITLLMGGGGAGAKYAYETAEQKLAPGRQMAREMEQQLARTEFVEKAGDIAKEALSPEMAQIKATPQAEKSVAMLVKEKLFDQGVDLTVPMDTIPTQPIAQLPEPVKEIKEDVTLDTTGIPSKRVEPERGEPVERDRAPAREPGEKLDRPTEEPTPSGKKVEPVAEAVTKPDAPLEKKPVIQTVIEKTKTGFDMKGQSKVRSSEVFGNIQDQPSKEARSKADELIESGKFDVLPQVEIPISDLIPTQRFISENNLNAIKDVTTDTNALIIKADGKHYILDGHHRIAANIVNEEAVISGHVFDFDTFQRKPVEKQAVEKKTREREIPEQGVLFDELGMYNRGIKRIFKTSDGKQWFEMPNGKIVDWFLDLKTGDSFPHGALESPMEYEDYAEFEHFMEDYDIKEIDNEFLRAQATKATQSSEIKAKRKPSKSLFDEHQEAQQEYYEEFKRETGYNMEEYDPLEVAFQFENWLGERLKRPERKKPVLGIVTKEGDIFDEPGDYNDLTSTKAEAHKSAKKNAEKTVDTLGTIEGSILANQMAKDYKEKGVTSLLGQTVATSLDLAVLGQVYRNPSFETFRFFFVREGIVVGQTGVTSRMPGETKLFPDREGYDLGVAEMRERMKLLKADGYYMFHNHPSGAMEPSRADKVATQQIADLIDGFKGHVIVNEKRYVKIDQDHLWRVHEIEGLTPEYNLSVPAKSGEMLGKKIRGPNDFALVGTEYYRPDWVVVVGRQGATGNVSGIMEIPISAIKSRTDVKLAAYIRAFQRKTASVDVSLTNVPRAIHRKVTNAIRHGWLLDAIDVDGKSIGGRIYKEGKPSHKAFAASVEEKKDNYYSYTFEPITKKPIDISETKQVKPPKGKKGVTIDVQKQTVFGAEIEVNGKTPKKESVKKGSNIFYAPGHNYVGLHRSTGIPERQDFLTIDGKRIVVPGKVQRIEPIIRTMTKIMGRRIYFGKIKGKALGFYRDATGEIRSKKKNDVEVLAHEMAHYLDMYSNKILPNFAKLYKDDKYSDQVMALSYTDASKKLQQSEGFAEFTRLWLTNANEAKARAPEFYKIFNKTLARDKRLAKPMKKMQEQMHKFYFQGADKLGQALVGDEGTVWGKINQWLHRRDSRIRQQMIDRFHAARKIEQELTGKISKIGESAWKQLRVSNGGYEAVADFILNYATINFDEKGDIVRTGRSLHDILKPIEDIKRKKEHLKDDKIQLLMRYFAGRRALELHMQGRENLLPVESAKAWARLGGDYPVFENIFKEYQQFNSRMMDFYEESGLLTHESRVTIQNLNKDYVPFYRIRETLTTGKVSGGGFHKLKGGTANLNDILVNIQDGVTTNIRHALNNKAKTRLYQYIQSHKDGAIFATRIAPDSKPVKVYWDDMANKINSVLDDHGIEIEGELDLSDPSLLMFWQHGVKPKVNESGNIVDTVLIEGKPRYYEVQDPLLQEMLLGMNTESYSSFMNVMFGVKNFFTRTITLGVEFTGANLVRDTIGAAFISKHHFVPFYDSFKGMYSFLKKDKHYQAFLMSGGGYSSRIEAMTREGKARRRVAIDEYGVLSLPEKLFTVFDHYSSAFEYGTRIGEFRLAKKYGETNMDAAFAAREISTDFSVLGANRFLTGYIRTIPFLNAMVQSQDRVYREALIQRKYDGHPIRFTMKAVLGITIPSLILYMFNKDDEEYKNIPDHEKRTNWHIKTPDGKRFIKIPRPYDVGFVFATMPELFFKYLEDEKGKEFSDGMLWTLTQMYGVDGTPAMMAGWWDLVKNEKWTGAPVVPHALADVEATEQYNANTSETFIRLGQALGMSPIKAEHAFKAYTGYLGGYLLWGTNKLLWDEDRFGPEPERDISSNIFMRRFLTPEVRPSTHAMEKFFDLKEKSDEVVATFKTRTDVRRAIAKKSDKKIKFEKDRFFGLSGKEKEVLFGLNDSMNKLITSIYGKKGIKTAELVIRFNKNLSAKEKRKELDKLWISRNKMFMTYYDAANKALLKAKKEAEKFNQEKK